MRRHESPHHFKSPKPTTNKKPVSSPEENSQGSLEAAMLDIDDSVNIRQRSPSPKVNSSFANDFFDFDGYAKEKEGNVYSGSARHAVGKRVMPRTPSPISEQPAAKFRRIEEMEPQEEESLPEQSLAQQVALQVARRGLPAWINNMDPGVMKEFLDEYADIVEFVD